MKETISDNLRLLHGRIVEACEKYDRDADDIIIVAITKTHPAAAIKTAVAAGIRNIGENRVQEAESKIKEVGQIGRFHLVGHLQSNKVKKAVEIFDVIQSVDSFKLAEEINRRAAEIDRVMECYLEVNCSGEEQKYGARPDEVITLINRVRELDHINLTGLMTVGPLTGDQDKIRESFRKCRELFKAGRDIAGDDFDTLSMGMSDDFPLAIAEGSTMIRIGTGIFGPRES
ncbi:MAG: YggS family pyridoxal phosphate-dependent enzyme [Candidatus Zixiibacteriota bacterium]